MFSVQVGLIIGLVIGSGLCCCCVILVLAKRRKRKHSKDDKDEDSAGLEMESGTSPTSITKSTSIEFVKVMDEDEFSEYVASRTTSGELLVEAANKKANVTPPSAQL